MFIALKFVLRQLLKTPGFTATALATIAICVGANLTIFAVIDAVLVRSLPFPAADRLVVAFNSYPLAGVERSGASVPNYYDRRGGALKAFASVSVFGDGSTTVGGADSPTRVPVTRVSPEFFSTLGVHLATGQFFTDANSTYGADEVAILTDTYWRNHFAADPAVLGRTFLNDGISIRVIGVLPRGFNFLSNKAEFYRPAASDPKDRLPPNRHSNGLTMIARLAPGATVAEAQAEMDAFNAQQLKDDPYAQLIKGAGFRTTVAPLHADYVRTVKPMLLLLQAGVLFLLLIGAVNLVNLLLIRASSRTKELAVRQALGARRRHIIRDVVTETMLLALGGGLGGLLLGAQGIKLLRTLGTDQLPLGAMIAFDGRVAAASLAAVIVFGLVLAVPIVWFHLHTRLAPGLQAEGRGGTPSRATQRLRQVFIVTQVALAFVLLSGAGLLQVSLKHVLETPPGFHTDNILTGNISLPWKSYKDDASRLAFEERLLPALHAIPGVTYAAVTDGLPFTGSSDNAIVVEGIELKPGETIRAHYTSAASSEYWPLMGIALVRGRLLTEADSHSKQLVCVIDEAVAKRYWPGADPLGHRLARGASLTKENATTVVGVVASVKQNELAEDAGHGAVYFPFSADNSAFFSILVRSPLPPAALVPMLRNAILKLDPGLPIDDLRPMQSRIDDSLVARRSPAVLAGIFAAVALLLAAVGTYGVLSYAVTQRRREIGVRMALGAQPRQIRDQFLSVGLRLIAVGTLFGLVGAWCAGQAMQTILFGVPALHAATLGATVLVLGSVALVACFLPAHRAANLNPLVALRDD